MLSLGMSFDSECQLVSPFNCLHLLVVLSLDELQPMNARVSRGRSLDISAFKVLEIFFLHPLHMFAELRCTMASHLRAAPKTHTTRSAHTAAVAEIYL
jgi:hypothetical protein